MFMIVAVVTLPAAPLAAGKVEPVSPGALDVTSGKVKPLRSGLLQIDHNSVRAVQMGRWARNGKIRFESRGQTAELKPFKSGIVKEQIGLKLRAMDGCNLVYVMWTLHPKEEITVRTKENPNKTESEDCESDGYTLLDTYRVPQKKSARNRRTSRLQADFVSKGNRHHVLVYVDNVRVLQVRIPHSFVSTVNGPVGLRSDNGRFRLRFWTGR
jgi:hypothetical protein